MAIRGLRRRTGEYGALAQNRRGPLTDSGSRTSRPPSTHVRGHLFTSRPVLSGMQACRPFLGRGVCRPVAQPAPARPLEILSCNKLQRLPCHSNGPTGSSRQPALAAVYLHQLETPKPLTQVAQPPPLADSKKYEPSPTLTPSSPLDRGRRRRAGRRWHRRRHLGDRDARP